jgi:hypothetical protein
MDASTTANLTTGIAEMVLSMIGMRLLVEACGSRNGPIRLARGTRLPRVTWGRRHRRPERGLEPRHVVSELRPNKRPSPLRLRHPAPRPAKTVTFCSSG